MKPLLLMIVSAALLFACTNDPAVADKSKRGFDPKSSGATGGGSEVTGVVPKESAQPTGKSSGSAKPVITSAPLATGPISVTFTKVTGLTRDAKTGNTISGVCVYAGPAKGCPTEAPRTDATGAFSLELPAGYEWAIQFEHEDYLPLRDQLLTTVGTQMSRTFQLQPK